MTTTTQLLAGLGALILTAGCGGAATEGPTTTQPDEPVAAADDVIPSPPMAWEEMSMEERRSWMGDEVMPRMADLFEGHDPEKFGGFSCDGCHGETGADRNWEMPNPDIFPLYATGSQEQLDMVNDQRPMVNFMFQEVVPAMKTLLGAADYDPETEEGFSCYVCHPNGGEGTPAAEEASSLWIPRGVL